MGRLAGRLCRLAAALMHCGWLARGTAEPLPQLSNALTSYTWLVAHAQVLRKCAAVSGAAPIVALGGQIGAESHPSLSGLWDPFALCASHHLSAMSMQA